MSGFAGFFQARRPARIAERRLLSLLAADRAMIAGPDVLDKLQREIVASIRRHVRGGRVHIRQGVSAQLSVLEIDIDLESRRQR
jgi:cell division topological specificity factor MinE